MPIAALVLFAFMMLLTGAVRTLIHRHRTGDWGNRQTLTPLRTGDDCGRGRGASGSGVPRHQREELPYVLSTQSNGRRPIASA